MLQAGFLRLHQHNDNRNEFWKSLPLSYAFQVEQVCLVALVRIHSLGLSGRTYRAGLNDRGSDRVTPCRCRCINTWPAGDNGNESCCCRSEPDWSMTMDVIFSSLHHCHRFRGGVGGVAAMTIRVSVFATIVEAQHTGFSRSDRSDNDSDRDHSLPLSLGG